MSRRLAGTLIAGSALTLLVLLVLISRALRDRESLGGETGAVPTQEKAPPGEAEVELFFPGGGGLLYREARSLPFLEDPIDQAKEIVAALIEGPASDSLVRSLPEGTELRSIHRGAEDVLFVSLKAPPRDNLWSLGSRAELLMTYSLVNSLALNIDGIERIALVWDGVQRSTLAGHVDTTRPLGPSRTWVSK